MTDLNDLRAAIDRIDREIQGLFEERMAVAEAVAAYKKAHGLPVLDSGREELLLKKLKERASNEELGEEIVRLYTEMLAISRARQEKRLDKSSREETT